MPEVFTRKALNQKKTNSLINAFLTHSRLRRDISISSEELLSNRGDAMRSAFSTPDATPVLICAWNEETSLPRLLNALSYSSTKVKPIVVDNNSSDGTGDIARYLGAHVIREDTPGLMPAQISGFQYLAGIGAKTFLITDADSYPVSTWAESMVQSATSIGGTEGGVIFGTPIYYGSSLPDIIRDTARNISEGIGNAISSLYGKVVATGPNGCINLGENEKIKKQLLSMNPAVVLHQDRYLRDQVIEAGGRVKKNSSPRAWVFTDGDRYTTFWDLFSAPPYGSGTERLYREWTEKNPNGIVYRSTHNLWDRK